MVRRDPRRARFGRSLKWPTTEATPTAAQADQLRDMAAAFGGTLWDLLPALGKGPAPGFHWSLPDRWPTTDPAWRVDV